MTKSTKTDWVECAEAELTTKVAAILRRAGFIKTQYLCFSICETTQDGTKEDLSDWRVRHPDFAAPFAAGKVQFVSSSFGDDPVLSPVYTDPTWADVVVEGERSCRMRGAPELDHIFLESVEPGRVVGGVQRYVMHFGS